MKNRMKWFGIIALIAVIGLTFCACPTDDGGGEKAGNPQTATYTGTSGGATYTLTITENTARYAAQSGDAYELTVGAKKSAGKVDSVASGVLTLKPSNATATFTAAVSGNSLTALNGTITWTDNTEAAAPGALTSGGGSSDWTAVTDSTFGTSTIFAIAYGNDTWVAGGRDGKMAYSSDGVTWTAVTDSTFGTTASDNDIVNSIAYGNNKFVAVSGKGKMAYSSDGVTWTAISTTAWDFTFTVDGNTITEQTNIYAIACENNKFVAGGGRMAYSSDGVTWTAGSVLTSTIFAIAYGNDTWVAGGAYGGMAYSK